jgi:SNF2 family DNA or RNA helicase
MEKMSTTPNPLARAAQTLKEICGLNQQEVTDLLAGTPITQSSVTPKKRSITTDYKWTGKFAPFAHQKATAEFLTLNRKAFCFNEQGTGKTASVIWACDYLMKLGLIRRVLVICPLSIMKSAWQADLFKFAMHRTCDVAHGLPKKRKEIIAQGAEFVVINFDGVEIVKNEILVSGFDLVVVDEASAYKNAQTTRWKVLRDITQHVKGLWMLTGTPAAQSPVDAYGLAKLINPENTPKFYGSFRDQVMYKLGMYRWIPKPNAQATVHKVLQPAIRFEKKDCIDLPELTFVDREAPLTPQQQKYYKMLKERMTMVAAGEEVSAVNAATNINKLLQISGGAVYSDTGEVVEFDVSNRLKVVHEVIDEASHKVLVFVPFTHTIELLREYLQKHHITCDVINGKVPVNKRHEIINDFQTTDKTRVLIIQPQAASHGLTLTEANVIIWYAPVTSVETYLQANARINRPGQRNPMTIVHVTGSEVEARLYKMLSTNIDNHEKLIDLYRNITTTP